MIEIFSDLSSLVVDKSCLGCAKYFGCKVPEKSGAWICKSFTSQEDAHVDDLLDQAQIAIDLRSTRELSFVDDEDEVEEFEHMINSALADTRLAPLDLNVDDSDLLEAKNFYEWCFGPVGIKFKPFARQLWIATMLFAEYCPRCSDPDWISDIENIPVNYRSANMPEHITFLEYGICPECGARRSELHKSKELNIYLELAVCLGQRSGKSIMSSALISYHLHKLLKTTRPAEFYGLASSTTLTHTYTALQYKRAYALLWTPIRDTILDSAWFKQYHALLRAEGDRLGQELVVIKDTFINWKRSRLLAAPAAPNIGTLRGDSRAGAAIDELGFFRFGDGAEDYITISADEIHASLTNSLATVRTAAGRMIRGGEDNVQQGIMFNMSSPSSVFDKIMTLVRAARNSRTMLGVRLPTWEVNPMIDREDLQIYWDTNPIKAERDFGANPPLAASPFFGDQDSIEAIFNGGKNACRISTIERTHPKSGVLERAAKIEQTFLLARQPQSLLTIDAGVTNNSFALSISIPVAKGTIKSAPRQNGQGFENKPHEDIYRKKKHVPPTQPLNLNTEHGENIRIRTILTVEIMPPKNGRINFNKMLKTLIIPLLKPFNVSVVVADRWNSILLLDQLRDEHGVHAFQYSLRYKDFEAIRSYVEGGRVTMPDLESRNIEEVLSFDQESYPYCFEGSPVDHLAMQFLTVQDTGRTVDKGPNLTDDGFRTIALAVHYLRNIDFVKQYMAGPEITKVLGGGLIAIAGGEQSAQSVAMTSQSGRGLIAIAGGSGGSGDGNSHTFARTKR